MLSKNTSASSAFVEEAGYTASPCGLFDAESSIVRGPHMVSPLMRKASKNLSHVWECHLRKCTYVIIGNGSREGQEGRHKERHAPPDIGRLPTNQAAPPAPRPPPKKKTKLGSHRL